MDWKKFYSDLYSDPEYLAWDDESKKAFLRETLMEYEPQFSAFDETTSSQLLDEIHSYWSKQGTAEPKKNTNSLSITGIAKRALGGLEKGAASFLGDSEALAQAASRLTGLREETLRSITKSPLVGTGAAAGWIMDYLKRIGAKESLMESAEELAQAGTGGITGGAVESVAAMPGTLAALAPALAFPGLASIPAAGALGGLTAYGETGRLGEAAKRAGEEMAMFGAFHGVGKIAEPLTRGIVGETARRLARGTVGSLGAGSVATIGGAATTATENALFPSSKQEIDWSKLVSEGLGMAVFHALPKGMLGRSAFSRLPYDEKIDFLVRGSDGRIPFDLAKEFILTNKDVDWTDSGELVQAISALEHKANKELGALEDIQPDAQTPTSPEVAQQTPEVAAEQLSPTSPRPSSRELLTSTEVGARKDLVDKAGMTEEQVDAYEAGHGRQAVLDLHATRMKEIETERINKEIQQKAEEAYRKTSQENLNKRKAKLRHTATYIGRKPGGKNKGILEEIIGDPNGLPALKYRESANRAIMAAEQSSTQIIQDLAEIHGGVNDWAEVPKRFARDPKRVGLSISQLAERAHKTVDEVRAALLETSPVERVAANFAEEYRLDFERHLAASEQTTDERKEMALREQADATAREAPIEPPPITKEEQSLADEMAADEYVARMEAAEERRSIHGEYEELPAEEPAFALNPPVEATLPQSGWSQATQTSAVLKPPERMSSIRKSPKPTSPYPPNHPVSVAFNMNQIAILAEEILGYNPFGVKTRLERGALGVTKKVDQKYRAYLQAAIAENPTQAEQVLAHEVGHLILLMKDSQGKMPLGVRQVLDVIEALSKTMTVGSTRFNSAELRAEAQNIQQRLRPHDTTSKYPEVQAYAKNLASTKELAADAISMLLTNPRILRNVAPRLYDAIAEGVLRDRVGDSYSAVLGAIRGKTPEEVAKFSMERGLQKAEELSARQTKRRQEQRAKETQRAAKGWITNLRVILANDQAAAINLINRAAKAKIAQANGDPAKIKAAQVWRLQATEGVEAIKWEQAQIYHLDRAYRLHVMEPLRESAGLTEGQINELLTLRRVANDPGRSKVFNPEAHTPATARAAMDEMLKTFTPEQRAVISKALDDFWVIRQDVINEIKASGTETAEMIDKMENTPEYVKFTPEYYSQEPALTREHTEGTIQPPTDPLTRTIEQDKAMLRSARRSIAMRKFVDAVRKFAPDGIIDQGVVQDNVLLRSAPRGMETLTYRVGGKNRMVFIESDVAKAFLKDPQDVTAFTHAARVTFRLFDQMVRGRNPIWLANNFPRDFFVTMSHNQEFGIMPFQLMRELPGGGKLAMIDVWGEKKKGQNRMLSAAKRRYAQVRKTGHFGDIGGEHAELTRRYKEGVLTQGSGYLERTAAELLHEMGKYDAKKKNLAQKSKIWAAVRTLGQIIDDIGVIEERTMKLSGASLLEKKGVTGPEFRQRVRGRTIGTPDVTRRGSLSSVLNLFFPYSSIKKEGWVNAWKVATKSPKSALSYAAKLGLYNIGPKAIMFGVKCGLFMHLMNRWTEELEKHFPDSTALAVAKMLRRTIHGATWTLQGATEYDLENYMVVPIPWITKGGQGVYVRIPHDHSALPLARALWVGLNALWDAKGKRAMEKIGVDPENVQETGYRMNDFAKRAIAPELGSMNPWIDLLIDGFAVMISNNNPIDSYTGRRLIGEATWKAGDTLEIAREFALKELSKMTGPIIGGGLWIPRSEALRNLGPWEEMLRRPPLKGILNSFVKVTDYGVVQTADHIARQAEVVNEAKLMQVKRAAGKLARRTNGAPTINDLRTEFQKLLDEKVIPRQGKTIKHEWAYFRNRVELASTGLGELTLEESALKRAKGLEQQRNISRAIAERRRMQSIAEGKEESNEVR